MKKTLVGIAVTAAMSVGGAAHAALYLDAFTDGQFTQDNNINDGAITNYATLAGTDCPSILGCERDVTVQETVDNNPSGTQQFFGARVIVGGSQLSFISDPQTLGYAIIQWDGKDSSPNLDKSGLGGVDLFAYGAGFTVETLFLDQTFDIVIGAYTDNNYWTEVTIQTTALGVEFISFVGLEGNLPGLPCGYSDPTNAFSPIKSVKCGPLGAADMHNFGAAQFIINDGAQTGGGTFAVDITIGPIAVPEPGTLSLLGMGFLAAAAPSLRRRRLSKVI